MARRGWVSVGIVLSSIAAGVAGCSSSDDGDPGVSLAELPKLYASAACQALTSCLGGAVDLFLNGQDCADATEPSVTDLLDGIQDALDSGKMRYDGTKIGACMDALRGAGCDYGTAGAGDACLAALDGTVALGGACDFNAECEGTAYCKSGSACPGTCTRAESEGGRCTSDSDCATGLQCDETKGECFTPASAGSRCGGGVEPECDAGLFCLGADEDQSRAGTCRLLTEVLSAGEGDACHPVDGPLCDPDLSCAITAVTPAIQAKCQKGASGGACKVGFPDPCPSGNYCKAPASTLEGTCTARPAAGEACASGPFGGKADICSPDTRCDGGTCRARQKLGGTCVTDAVCFSEHCVDGRCALDGACE